MGCCFSVSQDEILVIERCGKFQNVAEAGLHINPLMCVCVDEVAGKLSKRIESLDIRVLSKTKDNVFVTIVVAVQYQVILNKVYEANYRLKHPARQMESYVFDVVRSTVPQLTLEKVFTSKDFIAGAVKQELAPAMDSFGWCILNTLVVDVLPDARVRDAMNAINASKRQRQAAKEKAKADKVLIVKRAEGEAETKFLQGMGVARQRKAIVDGLRDSVQTFSASAGGVPAREVLDLVLITQYFDTLKELGESSGRQTVFIPHNPGSLAALAEEIRGGIMMQIDDIAKPLKTQ